MVDFKNKRSLIALVALVLSGVVLLSSTPVEATPRMHMASSKHSSDLAHEVRELHAARQQQENEKEKRLVSGLPLVGGLTKSLPLGLKREEGEAIDENEKRLVSGLPLVGGLTKSLPLGLKREEALDENEKRLVSGLPLVGGLTKSLPLGLKREEGEALDENEKRLVSGLPLVGGLTKSLPLGLKRNIDVKEDNEKRLLGGGNHLTTDGTKPPLIDILGGYKPDLNILTARDERLINSVVEIDPKIKILSEREPKTLIDSVLDVKPDVKILSDRDTETLKEKRLLGGNHLTTDGTKPPLIDILGGYKPDLNILTARDEPLIDSVLEVKPDIKILSDRDPKTLIDSVLDVKPDIKILSDRDPKTLIDSVLDVKPDIKVLSDRDEPLLKSLIEVKPDVKVLSDRGEKLISSILELKPNVKVVSGRDEANEKRLLGGSSTEGTKPALIDGLIGYKPDLNILTAREEVVSDRGEKLISSILELKPNVKVVSGRDEDNEKRLLGGSSTDGTKPPLIDILGGYKPDLEILTARKEVPKKRLLSILNSLPLVGGGGGVGGMTDAVGSVANPATEAVTPVTEPGTVGTPTDAENVDTPTDTENVDTPTDPPTTETEDVPARKRLLGGVTKSLPLVGGLLPVRRAADYEEYNNLSERDDDVLERRSDNSWRQHMANGKLTWYSGHQMDAPACGGATPNDHSYVVAVNERLKHHCGDTVRLHHDGKVLYAKVADWCGNCPIRHLDASQAVFSHFAKLDQGEIHGMDFTFVGKNEKDAHKLGPLNLDKVLKGLRS